MARLKKYCFLAGYLPISFSQYLLQANLSVITKYKILKLTNEKDIDDTTDNQDQNLWFINTLFQLSWNLKNK